MNNSEGKKKIVTVDANSFNILGENGTDPNEVIRNGTWIPGEIGDYIRWNPNQWTPNPPSGWGYKGVGQLDEEQLKDLLEKLQGLNKKEKKDQFDINGLSEAEKKELVKEVKEIISRKR